MPRARSTVSGRTPESAGSAPRAGARPFGGRDLRRTPRPGLQEPVRGRLRVLHPGTKLVGRAFTVQFMPARPDVEGVFNTRAGAQGLERFSNQFAIDQLQPGDVLVVDLFGKEENGTIVGDNLFYYVMKATKAAASSWTARSAISRASADGDARVLSARAPERHRERDAHRGERAGQDWRGHRDAGRPRRSAIAKVSTSSRRRSSQRYSTRPTRRTSMTSGPA